MKAFLKSFSIVLISFTLLLSSIFFSGPVKAKEDSRFREPVNLGSPIESVAVYDSAYGVEDGRDMMYTTSSGNPAIFQVIDLASREVLRTYPLEGTGAVWTHITVPNGNVYIGGNGFLYEYSPVTKVVKNLGGIGESVVYGLSYDDQGRVYFGSFPNAKAGRYDPKTGEMKDYGSIAPGQSYSRSTAYHNGFLYLGIGVENVLVKLDVESGKFEKIGLPDHVVPGSSVWQLDAAGKYIIAGVGGGSNTLLFYDTETGQWSDKYYLNNKGLRLVHGLPGSSKVYFLQGNRLKEVDLDTLNAVDTGVVFGTYLRNTGWVEVENDPDLPGKSLVTVQFAGQVTFINLQTKKVKTIQYPVAGNPIPIQTLEKGPDGNLYLSGYPGGKGAVYNPETDKNKNFTLGQAEGMVPLGNNMYFGVYAGAFIFEMDVTSPALSPKQIYDIPEQDRPFIMTAAKNKLYIGTIPDYGHLGGSLTVLDPASVKDTVVYPNVVHNQAIAGLAEVNGKLYGSTTVAGGLGTDPTEQAAKIFIWDMEKGEKITEFVPEIPGVTVQPKMISGMSLGPDGLLWSAADGSIFAMDSETLEIVKSKNIFPEVKDYGRWRPAHIRWSEDGLMYTTLAGNLTIIDPVSLEHEVLAKTELMTIGNDGNIYYADKAYLKKIEVSNTLESVLSFVQRQTEYGNIKNSVSMQLANSITSAIHHRDMRRQEQAAKHLQDALKHLENAEPMDMADEAFAKLKSILSSIKL
ncbi:FIMAH domain-containing protein [Bacillus sp. FJAT-27245]|uniref:FIMAH domain-containing protein n=1 Tax=Bacillus sp. FJAT-27245 TaxID=1684144 RepID=UPI0006A77DC9|nr:PQQ-binding-like beta-propeller repeat protein [Bacillus sp. FJAT-27245]